MGSHVTLPLADDAERRARAFDFDGALRAHGLPPLRRGAVRTLQLNLGKRCNQACHHCHVDAGPNRTEVMPDDVMERTLSLLERSLSIETVDITGGAPELHPAYRRLVRRIHGLGRAVIDRCNLTVMFEPGMQDLPDFFADLGVRVVASLPCYSAANVNAQRGSGVFEASMRALRLLNAVGYGWKGSGLELDLVYNPLGPSLPPAQAELEADYERRLLDEHGIVFSRLLTITNMPIRRFAHSLARDGKLDAYMQLLRESFSPATVDSVMCRDLISVAWDGTLYDCDFNQMLALGLVPDGADIATVWDLDSFDALSGRAIGTEGHCFGCTAGAGSSCSGALEG